MKQTTKPPEKQKEPKETKTISLDITKLSEAERMQLCGLLAEAGISVKIKKTPSPVELYGNNYWLVIII